MKRMFCSLAIILLFGCSSQEPLSERGICPQLRDFDSFPTEILESLQLMGIDSSRYLNNTEGRYFNLVFGIDTSEYSLVGKKVGFRGGKQRYFQETKERYFSGVKYGVVGNRLYIFDSVQKAGLNGYDAVITSWESIPSSTKVVIERCRKGIWY